MIITACLSGLIVGIQLGMWLFVEKNNDLLLTTIR